jgi:hypothetical protein
LYAQHPKLVEDFMIIFNEQASWDAKQAAKNKPPQSRRGR